MEELEVVSEEEKERFRELYIKILKAIEANEDREDSE